MVRQKRTIDMKKLSVALGLALALLPVLAGCHKVRYPAYYTLNLPPAPDPPAQEKQTSIAVREFQAPGYLRQGPIVYRSTPEEIGFYEYHRWAADPRKTVTSAVVDDLRASGQFSMVSTYDGRRDIEYVFSGRLEKLEEVDYDGRIKVEVALSAQITKISTGATVWSNNVFEVGKVSQRTVPGVVAQMNHTMELAINKLLSTIPASLPADK
jgi:ABC-type uncharacterized transport system auxiliary subunit